MTNAHSSESINSTSSWSAHIINNRYCNAVCVILLRRVHQMCACTQWDNKYRECVMHVWVRVNDSLVVNPIIGDFNGPSLSVFISRNKYSCRTTTTLFALFVNMQTSHHSRWSIQSQCIEKSTLLFCGALDTESNVVYLFHHMLVVYPSFASYLFIMVSP
jgi:hypothetical protein